MRVHTLFKEYIWLINTIAKARKITLEEINAKWRNTEMSEGIDFSRRTFMRHKIAIEEMFGIYIDCDRRDNFKYYIGNIEVLHENTIQNWMLSTLSVNNLIGSSMSLQDRIIIESVPVDNEHLPTVINAMKNRHRLVITYHKYGEAIPKDVLIEPYCLKMFKQRWYVVANVDGKYKTYSLDRIKFIHNDGTRFKMNPSFDAHSYFDEYFGILHMDEVKCEKVVIRAFGKERFYLRDLPLHNSQKEIKECEEYTDFRYMLHPTSDFASHLLSRSSQIKVLEPKWLADEVKKMALSVAKLYD